MNVVPLVCRFFVLAAVLAATVDSFSIHGLHAETGRIGKGQTLTRNKSSHFEVNDVTISVADSSVNQKIQSKSCSRQSFVASSSVFLLASLALMASNSMTVRPAVAFEGGIGGLGKTKPETGVVYWNENMAPQQSSSSGGVISAELNVNGKPVFVRFDSSWPLLSTAAGLEVRDVRQPESAFVQVISGVSDDNQFWFTPALQNSKSSSGISTSLFKEVMVNAVFSQRGKFGAYGQPTDVKVKRVKDSPDVNNLYSVTFTTLTPGLRESDRQALVKCVAVADSLVLMIAGTTRQRFSSQEKALRRAVESFEAVEAPSRRR